MKNLKLSEWIRTGALAGSLILLPLVVSASAQTSNTSNAANSNTARTTTQTQTTDNNDHDYGWLGLLGLTGLLGLLKKPQVVREVHEREVNRTTNNNPR